MKTLERQNFKAVGTTAHFTAAVWAELGVPNAALFATKKGKLISKVAHWGGATLGLFGKYDTINLFLKVRHLGLNALLEQKNPAQVIELAAGLSPRGYNRMQKHAGIYVEVDQAPVVAAKQAILAKHLPPTTGRLELVALDLVHEDYTTLVPEQLALNRHAPTLIIVEGLTGYLEQAAMQNLLQKIYKLAAQFSDCTVLIDFYLKLNRQQHGRVAYAMYPAQLFWRLMNAPMRMFLTSEEDIKQLVKPAGFSVRYMYTVENLAILANCEPPPKSLFYVGELQTLN
jgi:O-methyltransferase involved in polyketide biosynthesis